MLLEFGADEFINDYPNRLKYFKMTDEDLL